MRLAAFSQDISSLVKGPVLFEPFSERFAREGERPLARLHIYGTISACDLDWWGGLSTASIAAAILDAANEGCDVELVLDTPGGSVVGLDEVCNAIEEAQKTVTVSAYIRGMACSAGIWIASQCHPLRSSPLGVTGSIGVQLIEAIDAESGTYKVFRSTGSERKNADPITDPEQYQKLVDDAATNFVAQLAKGRGIEQTKVLERFGNGALLSALEALSVGLIDEIVDPARSEEMARKAETPAILDEKLPEELPVEEKPVEDKPAEEPVAEEAPVEAPPAKTVDELMKEVEDLRKQLEEKDKLVKEYEDAKAAAQAAAHASARKAAVESALKAGKITPAQRAHAEKLFDLQAAGQAGLFDSLVAAKAPAYPTARQGAGEKVASKVVPGDAKSVFEAAKSMAAESGIDFSSALRKITENK